ncbi:Collagen alpha-5(VI) chain [Desmophyllum pertusum]|uniref:Collagen alpha-5(VI) chain n=1 Tax=Desmophyllum pertusum TaxID=174260 RepID=A0A9X0CVH5_9CNID|nr:Collagen alpha-5(VI) chain [Desmophyllum pertusum]
MESQPRDLDKKVSLQLLKIVKILEDKGVYIYAVGIGRRIRETALRELAGNNGGYSKVADFDKLPGILEGMKEAACANAGASSDEQGQIVNGVLQVDRGYYNRYRSPMERFFN